MPSANAFSHRARSLGLSLDQEPNAVRAGIGDILGMSRGAVAVNRGGSRVENSQQIIAARWRELASNELFNRHFRYIPDAVIG
jgi:hypothetical protein